MLSRWFYTALLIFFFASMELCIEELLYNCYKGSQNTSNALNISKLYVFKGSHRLHIISYMLFVTYWYTIHCVCCMVRTKGSRFVVNPCEPFVNPWICAIDCNSWGYVELWTLMQKDLKKNMQPESKNLWYSALFITFKRYLHISITNEKHQILKF